MHYPAVIVGYADGTYVLTFPDAPGCVAQTEPGDDPIAVASEALDGWLRSSLAHGEVPVTPRPRHELPAVPGKHLTGGVSFDDPGVEYIGWAEVPVAARSTVPLLLRWARRDRSLSQRGLATLLRVTPQQVSKLEDPNGDPKLSTLERVAAALELRLELTLEPVRVAEAADPPATPKKRPARGAAASPRARGRGARRG